MVAAVQVAAGDAGATDVVAAVRRILSVPDAELDYGEAKLALDRLVDPSIDTLWAEAELERLASAARSMAALNAPEPTRLGALRKLLFDGGPWNEHRPFCYNPEFPEGTHIPDKLFSNFLRTRLGNCVSMPILMLVLAEKLGIDLRLASAPHHMFVRYVTPEGQVINIEATSGGFPARDEWFRQNFAMTDRAIESGLYMRTLSRRESLVLMAETLLSHLTDANRHEEVIRVSQALLEHDPRSNQAMLWQASACAALVQREFASVYPSPLLIPPLKRARYLMLSARNEALFARAEALGWTPDRDETCLVAAYPKSKPEIERRDRC